MFGRRIYGKKEVISAILNHGVFKNREGNLTKGLVNSFGWLYIQVLGWPASEPRVYHSRMVNMLQPCPSDSILDVGCGPGIHSLEIAWRYKASVTGLDIDEDDVRFANRVSEVNQLDNCCFMYMNATNMCFNSASFDKVICTGVLEHIKEDNLAVECIARVLRKGGMLVGNVPIDKRSLFKPDTFQTGDDAEGHGHVREGYSIEGLYDLLKRNGLKLVEYEYVNDMIQNLMLLIEEKTNRYIMFPFTYPVSYFSSRLLRKGTGILFKAVK